MYVAFTCMTYVIVYITEKSEIMMEFREWANIIIQYSNRPVSYSNKKIAKNNEHKKIKSSNKENHKPRLTKIKSSNKKN
jgi:hypothetical protein